MKKSTEIEYECLADYHGPKLCSFQNIICKRCPSARPLNPPSKASEVKAEPLPPK